MTNLLIVLSAVVGVLVAVPLLILTFSTIGVTAELLAEFLDAKKAKTRKEITALFEHTLLTGETWISKGRLSLKEIDKVLTVSRIKHRRPFMLHDDVLGWYMAFASEGALCLMTGGRFRKTRVRKL